MDARIRVTEQLITTHIAECGERNKAQEAFNARMEQFFTRFEQDHREDRKAANKRYDLMVGAMLVVAASSVLSPEALSAIITSVFR